MDFSSISAPKQLEFLAPGPTPRFRCTYSRPPRTRLCLILRHTWRKSSWRPCGGQAAKRRAAWSCCASWAVLRAPGATVSVVTLIMACCAPARSPSRPDVAVKRWIFTDFDGLFEGFWMISGLKPRCETLFFDCRQALTVLQSAFLGHQASGQQLLAMLLAENVSCVCLLCLFKA